MKAKNILFGILALLTVGVIGAGGYIIGRESCVRERNISFVTPAPEVTSTTFPSPSSTTTPEPEEPTFTEPEEITPSSEIDTSDWETYRNEEYGFEVRYPDNWNLSSWSITNPSNPGYKVLIKKALPNFDVNAPLSQRLIGRLKTLPTVHVDVWEASEHLPNTGSCPFTVFSGIEPGDAYQFFIMAYDNQGRSEKGYSEIFSIVPSKRLERK